MRGEVSTARRVVLLTGATGFVGRQIHRHLLAMGHRVRAIVRTGSAGRLIDTGPDTDFIETPDVFAQSVAWWATACAGCDTVVHAAWFVVPGQYLTSPANLTCVSGSLALAQGAVEAEVGHFIGIGTCFEYQLPSDHLTVDAPLAPTTLYASAKLSLYQLLGAFFAQMNTSFSWARLFYLYGEGEHASRLVPYVRQRLAEGNMAQLSAGTQVRDFLDVARAGHMIATLVATRQPGAINICSSVPVTVRQLAERMADEIGRRDLLQFGTAPLRPTDPAAVVGVCNLLLVSPDGSGVTS